MIASSPSSATRSRTRRWRSANSASENSAPSVILLLSFVRELLLRFHDDSPVDGSACEQGECVVDLVEHNCLHDLRPDLAILHRRESVHGIGSGPETRAQDLYLIQDESRRVDAV